jgi:LmbE family N-acetylglucosaminyl deacetylase
MKQRREGMAEKNRRVAAIGAHPDDVEFMCSGTLKLLKDAGFEIHIGVLANGDCGSMIESREEITKIRRKEAEDAAALLGARFHPMGELDLRIEFDEQTRMKVTEYIRAVAPLIVFTHPHEDYMNDHEYTSKLVRHACFAAPIPNYYTGAVFPHSRNAEIPHLYYWGPLVGRNIYGDFVNQKIYVNIDTTVEFKKKMLACHRSQRDWLMERHKMDQYIETMRETAVEYGKWCGFNHAEGFRQHLGNAYPQDNVLKDILGDLVKEM